MTRKSALTAALAASITLAPLAGCENLPGGQKEQGTAIGGLAGAAAGAALYKQNRLLGALLGGALGAGGGYLIGANWDKISGKDKDKAKEDAVKADQNARSHPATASDVEKARSADINGDGFVTLDEVVAMTDAGLSTKEQIRRLERTQQYFELTDEQERYLRDKGVSNDVILAMRDMNRDARTASSTEEPSTTGNQRISRDQSDRSTSSTRSSDNSR